jgi:hypothetical protein
MITPSFSLTATERVLPNLALDFTTASLDPRVTFTRALNTATRVNAFGLVDIVNADLPRFDYDPITLVCKGLLIEESRQNIVLYSQEFNNAYWFKNRASISLVDATVAPDGTTTADLLTEDTTASNTHYLRREFTSVSGTTYTWSVFLNNETRRYASLKLGDDGLAFAANLTRVDLLNGVIVTSNAQRASITALKDGWYRVDITMTAIASLPSAYAYVYLDNGTTNVYTGDGTSGIYIWGAQLEVGALTTSYIPTEASAVTRNADVATVTGTNFSDFFNPTEGTFAVEYVRSGLSLTGGDGYIFNCAGSAGSLLNQISLRQRNDTRDGVFIQDNGAVQWNANIGLTAANELRRAALAYKTSDFSMAYLGAAPITQSSGSVPSATLLYVGSSAGTQQLNGHLRFLRYWPQRLTNAEVQAFSK